jgi:YVTN family beta-propeller protein
VSHQTQVNILDETTGDSVGVIPNTDGIHGIAFATPFKKGYTSNGQSHNVTVFDVETNQVLGQIATGGNPDPIIYDPFSKKILVCAGRSKGLCVIDPATDKIIANIPLSGSPEMAVSDGNGKIFINVHDKDGEGHIDVVDIKKNIVLSQWLLSPGKYPTGLAIDVKSGRLFSGCFNKWLIVLDATNGRIIDSLTIGQGCDGVVFDSKMHYIMTANDDGTLSVVLEKSKNVYKVIKNIPTGSSNTLCIDPFLRFAFLPVSNFETDENSKKIRNGLKVVVVQY